MKSTSERQISGIGTIALAWLRTDIPRDLALRYWHGPHGQLVGRNHICTVYRQVRFDNSRTLSLDGWRVNTAVSPNEVPDGLAENFVPSYTRTVLGLRSRVSRQIFLDERNFTSRVLLYATMKGNCRYVIEHATNTAVDATAEGERIVLLFKRGCEDKKDFRRFMLSTLPNTIARDKTVIELHAYAFMPYDPRLWPSRDVDHSVAPESEYNGAIVFATRENPEAVLHSAGVAECVNLHRTLISKVNAFAVDKTFVMRFNDRCTLVAQRGAENARTISDAHAFNQTTKQFSRLFRP